MKIAIFTDTYYPQLNGVTISVSNYARELRKKGHTVYIFAPKFKNYKDHEKDVYRLPSIKILSTEPEVHVPVGVSYKGFFRLLQMDFDIIHAHGNGPFSFLGYEVARAEGVPYILTFHSMHTEYTHYLFNGKLVKPRMVARAMRFWANRCDGVIAPSEKMKQKLAEFGFRKDVAVIPNFVELSQLDETKKGYLHKKLGLAQNIPLLLSVGRLGKEKNFHFLIEVFAELAKKDTTSHLVLVGQGPEEKHLKLLAQQYGVLDRVHFTGRIANQHMPQVYADATVFVFASTTEVHPMVVLEATAAGVPMVVVNDLAFDKVAVHNKNAYIVPMNTKAFVEKIEKLLQDETLRKQFSMNAKKIIQENFQGDVLTESLLTFYRKMYAKHTLHARIFRRVNRMAARGFIRIRKTRNLLNKLVYLQ